MNLKKLLLPFITITLIGGVLWATNRSVSPKESTWHDVVAEAGDGGYRLISLDELKNRYETDLENTLLIDTRQEWEFASGHIAGAVNFPMEPTRWSRWWKKSELAQVLGPDKNRFIVFY
jgi:predicted sulfurtransferase